MPRVTEDLIEGNSLTRDANGYTIRRVFLVEELSGAPSQITFLAANTPPVPVYGEAHPTVSGLVCSSVEVEAVSQSQARVVATYGLLSTSVVPDEKQPAQISVGSSVQSVSTNKDVNGEVLLVEHIFESETDGETSLDYQAQTGEVELQVPQTVVRFSRRENRHPLYKSIAYTNKLNANGFLGDPPGYWMCTRIEGHSDDGGLTYQVEYEFQRNENGWKAEVVFIDPETNAPPPDVKQGFGLKTFEMYKRADFSQIGL